MGKKFIYFLILHYGSEEVTSKCIESILKLKNSRCAKIVVVDNASNNESYDILKEKYSQCSQFELLQIKEGKGFSFGNNCGYKYIVKKNDARLIVVCNNDIIFFQSDFLIELEKAYEEKCFWVAGPDIYNSGQGIHQNPFYTRICDINEIDRRIAAVEKELKFLGVYIIQDRIKMVLKKIAVLKKISHSKNKVQWEKYAENVCVHGACVIVSERFIEGSEGLFIPETTFYCEEDILAYRCVNNKWKIVYLPMLHVEHREGVATRKLFKEYRSRREFMLTNTLNSLIVFREFVLNKKSKDR